ncbi:hypothetical protein V6N13_062973 [Hibiscus sabdariffa]
MEQVLSAAYSDMKNLIGEASCRICQESFSTVITALTEPIDIYSEWIDECERVNNLEEEDVDQDDDGYVPRKRVSTAEWDDDYLTDPLYAKRALCGRAIGYYYVLYEPVYVVVLQLCDVIMNDASHGLSFENTISISSADGGGHMATSMKHSILPMETCIG